MGENSPKPTHPAGVVNISACYGEEVSNFLGGSESKAVFFTSRCVSKCRANLIKKPTGASKVVSSTTADEMGTPPWRQEGHVCRKIETTGTFRQVNHSSLGTSKTEIAILGYIHREELYTNKYDDIVNCRDYCRR